MRLLISSLTALLLSACADSSQSLMDNMSKTTAAPAQQAQATFAQWQADFTQRAVAQGIKPEIVHAVLSDVEHQPRVQAQDSKQPEFTRQIWQYVERAVSATRIANGKAALQANKALLNRLVEHYGVPASVLVAIWGVETGYGAFTGNTALPSALATLAFEGRRRTFAENQLMALMRLVEAGDIELTQLKGSWAGGMGQTQFIPTTYERYAVDEDHDGRRNLWTTADALASTANYLAQSGWQRGVIWGTEVRLPSSLSDTYLGQQKTWQAWQDLGLTPLGVVPQNPQETFRLWLPAGLHGPALLLSSNFDALRAYNHASSYALAVGLLADAIEGRSGLTTPWDETALGLSHQQIQAVQTKLSELGFDSGAADGILGDKTRRAFQAWQRQQGRFADGFISQQSVIGLIP